MNGTLGAPGIGRKSASSARTGVYLVRTDIWYVERAGWLISGLYVLMSSVLAWVYSQWFVLLITLCGLTSVMVSLTGFCPVGNVLHFLGMKSLLNEGVGRWYFLQRDCWYLERRIYLIVGVNLTVGSMLVLFVSPGWLFYTGFVGGASLFFALTGFCIMAHILYKKGKEPRLQRL